MFEYLKRYDEKHLFYKVSEKDIEIAEKRIKNKFPNELRTFYIEIGYGYFYDADECYTNVLMKPQDIADFVCGEENYFYSEEREFLSKEDLVFYEIESNIHVYIKLDGKDKGKVFLGKKEIAVSFKDFIFKLDSKSNYYFI